MHVWSGSARLTTISRSKETNPVFWKAWSSIFRIGANRILSRRLLRTTDGSKRERSGPPENCTAISIFPHVGQAFVIERHRTNKKSGESSLEVSYGLPSRPPK